MHYLKRIGLVIVMSIAFISVNGYTQSTMQADSVQLLQHKNSFQTKRVTPKSFIIPTALITTSTLGISGEFIILNHKIEEERNDDFPHFHTSIDNYLQFAPMAAGYAMLLKSNNQHQLWHYTEKVMLTEVMLGVLI